jgi:hypothetical protein
MANDLAFPFKDEGGTDRHHLNFRKKAVGRVVARLTAGVSVAMLRCYAGKQSSVVLPSMSAAATAATAVRRPATAATAVRRPATVRSATRRRMPTTTATGSGTSTTTVTRASAATVTRSRASAAAVSATIAAVRRTTVRARGNDRLPHVERRTRRSAVAPAFWAIAAACWTRTARRSVRTAVLCASHRWASGWFTAG